MSGALDAYGARASDVLARVQPAVEENLERFLDAFYRDLGGTAEGALVLGRLSPAEVQRLRRRQGEHMRATLDPRADEAGVVAAGRHVGQVHSMVGVLREWYVAAMNDYASALVDAVPPSTDPMDALDLRSILWARLTHEMQGVMRGYREMDAAESAVLARVGEVAASAGTVPDLAQGVLDALTDLPGLLAAFFGRPDADQHFVFELGAGKGVDSFLVGGAAPIAPAMTTLPAAVSGEGPAGRAWRSGEVQRSDAYLLDPTTAPWHPVGERHGFRASAAVPLSGVDGQPRALLSLYAGWPGYFDLPTRGRLLEHVRGMTEPALARLEARHGLMSGVTEYSERRAHLERLRTGEVTMLYQPIVELATGRVLKLEALARLGTGERLYSPGEFLPAFGDEDLELLLEIGLDHALAALVGWLDAGLDVGVSINLPASHGPDSRYLSIVTDALARYPVHPARLTLELLENEAVREDPTARRQVLQRIKGLGVHLAEDDLGSGHSSLLRMRRIAFDEVKIDQALVRGADVSPRDALGFIQPLTTMAHSRGLHVVVEGLETVGLIEAAAFLGADAGQGYGIARPLRAEAVLDWVRDYRLEVEPERPRTVLGALAAHLTWESRVGACATDSALWAEAVRSPCILSGFLDGLSGLTGDPRSAHERIHRLAITEPGSRDHRDAWDALATLLVGRTDGS